MFSKKSSTSKPKFLNLHTLAPITVAVLTVYSSAASADYVLKDGVSLTGTDPTVDIYHTDKNLTLTNSSGAALDKVGVEALATADFTFTSNGGNGSLKGISIQGFKGSGTLNISNTNGNALESNYKISGFENINITTTGEYTYALRGQENNSIQGKKIKVTADNNAIRFLTEENATLNIESFDNLTLVSKEAAAIRVETGSSFASSVKIIGNENSIVNIKGLKNGAIDINTAKSAKATTDIKGRYVNIEGSGKSCVNSYGHLSITADQIRFVNHKVDSSSSALYSSSYAIVDLNASKISTNDRLNLNGYVTLGESGKTTTVELKEGATFTAGYLKGGDLQFIFDELEAGKTYFSSAFVFKPTEEQLTADSVTIQFASEAVDTLSNKEFFNRIDKAVTLRPQLESNSKSDVLVIGNGTTRTLYTDENGGWTRVVASDITQQTIDLAAESLVAWRNETTTITDRLAALRGNTADYGAWVRWNGGAYKYDDRGMKNEFNTIEAGGDIKVSDNWLLGASFSYTEGEGTLDAGTADSDTYAGSFYALWTGQKGSFVDMVMKAGRLNTDFDFANRDGGGYDKGSIDRTGFILGIDTGHRFTLPANFFVEPQVQFIYSRLSSVDEVTAKRRVEIEASDSLIGRVGVMAGLNCPNDRGTVWVKASALRDFRGDVDGVSAMADGKAPFAFHEELDQNWAELALGADFKVSDNFYAFVDAQKSFGGDIELDWRANVGARFVW